MFTMKVKSSECVSVSVSLPRGLRDRARRAAFQDNRSLSSLVQTLLVRHLGEQAEKEQLVEREVEHVG